MVTEIDAAIALFLTNDAAIALLIYGVRRAIRKAARTSNLIPDMTEEEERAAKWWIRRQMAGLVEDYQKWFRDQVLDR